MTNIAEICSLCAWRATCQKKFSVSGRDFRCPDFAEDISIRQKAGQEADEEEEDRGGKED